MRIFSIIFILLVCFSESALSADLEGLTSLFTQGFDSGYESGQCQFNIRKFTAKARSQGIDLSGALYLTFRSSDSSEIWYYHGRSGRNQAASRGAWFHHYVLIVPGDDSSSSEFSPARKYSVIDFDFGNSPRVVDLRTYLREMFMSESVRRNESKIESNFELGLLKLTAHDASKLVSQLNPNGEFPRGAEAEATLFENVRFKNFYRSLRP